jgi:dihydropteroate synthase
MKRKMLKMKNSIYKLSWGGHSLELGKHTCVMGIVNVTPDSFSDGGQFFDHEAAIAHGVKLVKDGADIIDIGGESTRPFSESVSEAEEIRRVEPVIRQLAKIVDVPISIDTTKAAVARRAFEAGASMLNDTSALRHDPELADVAAEYEVPVILMHMLGTPKTMQVSPRYTDVVAEIRAFLENALERAEKKGIPRSKIVIDPGIGFGKTVEHNLTLITHLKKLKTLDVPILVGPSRKSFIRKILEGNTGRRIQPDLPALESGTQIAVAAAVFHGAHIVRVHDVTGACAAVKIADAIKAVAGDSRAPC